MFSALDIGIDLGTASVLIYVKGKGVVIKEPSVVALDTETNQVVAIGEEARRMIGRTPGRIIAIRPLREGVIADYDTTEKMLKYFVKKVAGRSLFFKPRIVICTPAGVTSVEKRAVLEAAMQAGASKTYLLEEPLAAALGAGIDISEPCGSMVVDIGGGTTDVAVLSLGGTVISESLRIGGDRFDEGIIRYIKKEYNLLVGENTAEEIKRTVATVHENGRNVDMEVRGRDLISGLPKTIQINSDVTREALAEPVALLVECVKGVLEKTPPELASDIMEKGIILTGGGAMLDGLDRLLFEKTGIPVYVADDPQTCVVKGTGKALDDLDKIKENLMTLHK